MAQIVTNQPDGPGKRIGKRGEVHVIGNVLPGGGKVCRERIAQFPAEAGYWEPHVGTVHDFRVLMFDNDTRILISAIYDRDFLPYRADAINQAGPWFDVLMPGVWEGYSSAADEATRILIERQPYTADAFLPDPPTSRSRTSPRCASCATPSTRCSTRPSDRDRCRDGRAGACRYPRDGVAGAAHALLRRRRDLHGR